VCSNCTIVKPASDFHRDSNKQDGLRGRCKECEAKAGRERRSKRPKTHEPTVTHKVCCRCGKDKPGAP
jgi:hypothetical protein